MTKHADSEPVTALVPTNFGEAKEMAKYYSSSSLLPNELRGKEADVFVTMMAGQELGLSPMAALRGIHVVKGRPCLGSHAMVAIVLSSGKAEYFRKVESSAERATYETKRKGAPQPQRQSFSMEDARRAELLGKDTWKKYPEEMLCARAKSLLARDVYPDLLMGVYADDEASDVAGAGEIGDLVAPAGEFTAPAPMSPDDADVQDAQIVDEDGDDEAIAVEFGKLEEAIYAAASVAELEALVARLRALPTSDRAALREVYAAKKQELADRQEPAQ